MPGRVQERAFGRAYCARLGLSFAVNKNNTEHSRGKVYDGSSFDYGFEECSNKDHSSYPWCPLEPDCSPASATSIIMKNGLFGGTHCWDDVPDWRKCAAVCKKKLD